MDGLAFEDTGIVFAADGDDAGGALGIGEAGAVLEELDAIHDGHAEVGEQDVEALGEEVAEAFFAVAGGDDFGAGGADQFAHREPRGRVILDDENAWAFGQHCTRVADRGG
jgi:hypothetical protein